MRLLSSRVFVAVLTGWVLGPSAGCSWWGSEHLALDPKHNGYLRCRAPACMGNCTQYETEQQEDLEKERVRQCVVTKVVSSKTEHYDSYVGRNY